MKPYAARVRSAAVEGFLVRRASNHRASPVMAGQVVSSNKTAINHFTLRRFERDFRYILIFMKFGCDGNMEPLVACPNCGLDVIQLLLNTRKQNFSTIAELEVTKAHDSHMV
jgi:hypothetical protein